MEQINEYISLDVAEALADTALKVTELIVNDDTKLHAMRAELVQKWDTLTPQERQQQLDQIATHKTRVLRLFIKDYMRRTNGSEGN